MVAHLVNHLARRGVQAAHQHWKGRQAFMARLEDDAQAYENSGPEMELHDWEFIPVAITGLVALLVIWSVCDSKSRPRPNTRSLTIHIDPLHPRRSHVKPDND